MTHLPQVWRFKDLDQPLDVATALVIEALGTGVRSAGFLVPGALGAQEGGLVAIFTGVGLGAGTALAFGLVRRVREAVWALSGYLLLVVWRGGLPDAPSLAP